MNTNSPSSLTPTRPTVKFRLIPKPIFTASFAAEKGIEIQLVSAHNEADEIAATALIQWEKSGGEEYGYLCYGFNLDYTNTETLQIFATALTELAKRRGAAYLRMELNIPADRA